MDHEAFLSEPKSMVIAPAGHGKTHAISDCLKHTKGKQLVLTHTHAGLSSIKEKMKKAGLSPSLFHIETISSYAQKYVLAYYTGTDIPPQEDPLYYPFIINKAAIIIQKKIVRATINATYTGLFVDEYQDCTLLQHNLILALSEILPTRIFGDHMQGIFSFGHGAMVDLTDRSHMGTFHDNKHVLTHPWRWHEQNVSLGNDLIRFRALLETKQQIDLREFPSFEIVLTASPADLYIPGKTYNRSFSRLLSLKDLLILHPLTSSIAPRIKIISKFNAPIALLESIDDNDFYRLAKFIDTLDTSNSYAIIYGCCKLLFNKTAIDTWLNPTSLKRKQNPNDKAVSAEIQNHISALQSTISLKDLLLCLKHISTMTGFKCYRKELLINIFKALDEALSESISVYEAMVNRRNHIRRAGRKIYGRCIGTTLLTKGLEFETVAVLNADEFTCPKNLYVALTRASKRLIIFTSNPILSPLYHL